MQRNKQEIRKFVSLGGNGEEYSKCTQSLYRLAFWVKFSADDILKYFSFFPQKTGFDISCKLSPLETICMECQILFPWKNKKNVNNLSSAELAKCVVKVNWTRC